MQLLAHYQLFREEFRGEEQVERREMDSLQYFETEINGITGETHQ